MSISPARKSNDDAGYNGQILGRKSVSYSSNPKTDLLPIDCVLVYDSTNDKKDSDKTDDKSELRRKFETYLTNQGLILNHVVSKIINYTSFYLLSIHRDQLKMD